MAKFSGTLFDLRDQIGEHLSKHVNELNKDITTSNIAKMHDVSLGVISNLNTKNYTRISLPTLLEAAQKLGFTYNFSVKNKGKINIISLDVKLTNSLIRRDLE